MSALGKPVLEGDFDESGQVVVQGTVDDVLKCKVSPTGQYLSGKRRISTPKKRRAERLRTTATAGCWSANGPWTIVSATCVRGRSSIG